MTEPSPRRPHRLPDAPNGHRPSDRLLERLVRARRARVRGRARGDRRDLEPEHRARGPAQGTVVLDAADRGARRGEPDRGPRSSVTWAVVEEMAVRGAAVLEPVFVREGGRKGRLSLQTNPANYPNTERMLEQGLRFASLAPNIQVKFPATRAGIRAIEAATAAGRQHQRHGLLHGRPGDRGRRGRRARAGCARRDAAATRRRSRRSARSWSGGSTTGCASSSSATASPSTPTRSTGPGSPRSSGPSAIYRERGYRTRLLAAAYRHRLHWTELVGGDVVLTMPHAWQVRFNASGIDPESRIDEPVDPAIVARAARADPRLRARLRAGRPDDRRVRRLRADGPDPARVHRVVPRPDRRGPRRRAPRSGCRAPRRKRRPPPRRRARA